MGWKNDQCRKVCRIIDDYLANRPTERDSLIVAVQKAFDALEKQRWIPCSERLPEVGKGVLLTTTFPTVIIGWLKSDGKWMIYENDGNSFQDYIIAWMPLPEPYQRGEQV